MSKFVNPTKVITGPNTRWSYANVWEAKSINGSTPKFSVSLIIPKTDTATIEKINRAIKAAYEEGQSKLRGNSKFVPDLESLKLPLRDGDKERKGDPAYAGCMFINANSSTASHPGSLRGVLRRLWPGQHQPVRLQQQRQQGYRLRAEQPAEDPGRRAHGKPQPRRGRFRH